MFHAYSAANSVEGGWGCGGEGSGVVDAVALVTAQNFPVAEVFTTTKMSYSMLLFISNHMNFNVRFC